MVASLKLFEILEAAVSHACAEPMPRALVSTAGRVSGGALAAVFENLHAPLAQPSPGRLVTVPGAPTLLERERRWAWGRAGAGPPPRPPPSVAASDRGGRRGASAPPHPGGSLHIQPLFPGADVLWARHWGWAGTPGCVHSGEVCGLGVGRPGFRSQLCRFLAVGPCLRGFTPP